MTIEPTDSPTATDDTTVMGSPARTVPPTSGDTAGQPADEWRSVLDDLLCAFEDEWAAVPQLSVEEFVASRLPPETGAVQRFVAVAELAKADFELALARTGDQRASEWLARHEPLRALPAIAAEMFVAEYESRCREPSSTGTGSARRACSLADFLRQVPDDLRDAVAARLRQPSRYTCDKQVGAGGQGEVWEGVDRELGRSVAVKLLRGDYRHASEARRRLVSEARVTSQLEHPGVVPVYGLEEHSSDGRPRYAMRYVRGETLTRRIRKYHESQRTLSQRVLSHDAGSARPASGRADVPLPRPDRPEAAEAELRLEFRGLLLHFVAVCKTVAFAHAHPQRFIHRDLKPDNVMVGEFGETIVMDWGLARPLAELSRGPSAAEAPSTVSSATDTATDTSSPTAHDAAQADLQSETTRAYTGTRPPDSALEQGAIAQTDRPFRTHDGVRVGTPAYMSPEQAGADFPFGTHTDVFGLGAILHYILANHAPHQAQPHETLSDVFRRIQSQAVPSVATAAPGIPRPLAAICDKALAFAPGDRYASAAELAAEVDRYLGDEPVEAYRESWGERCLRVIRKHPSRVATIAGVAAVLAAVAMLVVWYVPHSQLRARRATQIGSLADQEPDGVRTIVSDLAVDGSLAPYIERELHAQIDRAQGESPVPAKRLRRLRLALLPFPSGEANLDAVFDDLKATDDLRELGMACGLVGKFVEPELSDPYCRQLWELVGRHETPSADRLRFACVLAALDAGNSHWKEDATAADATESLVSGPLDSSGQAIALLTPVARYLEPSLQRVFREVAERPMAGQFAAVALATYYLQDAETAANRVGDLVGLLLHGTPTQQVVVLDSIPSDRVDAVCANLEQRVESLRRRTDAKEQELLAAGAAALFRLQPDKWDWSWLRHTAHPDVRTLLIHRIPQLRIAPRVLLARLSEEPDGSIRQAILLSLGRFPRNQLDSADVKKLSDFVPVQDAGEQAAAEWALRSLGNLGDGPAPQPSPQRGEGVERAMSRPDRSWWTDGNGHRMIAIAAQPKGATFWMGALDHEKAYAAADEPRYAARIERPYAISATETTVVQMEHFMKGYRQRHDADRKTADKTRPNDAEQQAEPASFVSLYHAMIYCNWLSKEEGIPEKQWCYPKDKLDSIRDPTLDALEIDDVASQVGLSKTGYRLPTEVEWEYACRAGTESSRHFGDLAELVGAYAHHRNNSPANLLSPVGRHMPNEWGLFDMFGNVAEWCHADPAGPKAASSKAHPASGIVRGGSIHDESVIVRSSYRILVPVNAAQRDIGFRVARTLHGE